MSTSKITRKELAGVVAASQPELTSAKATEVVDALIEHITTGLSDGRPLALQNIFTVEVVTRPARTGRNPRTGEAIEIPEKRALKIRTGKKLAEQLG